MGATIWLRKGKAIITGAVYLVSSLAQQRDMSSFSALRVWAELDDDALGAMVRERLEACRPVAAFPRHGTKEEAREASRQFDVKLANLFKLTSNKALFPRMKTVNIFREPPHKFRFHPTKNIGRGFFEEFSALWPDKQPFGIAQDASDAEIGAAARLAMDKSI